MAPVLAIGLALQLAATGVDLAALGAEVERAVTAGQMTALEQARKRLLTAIQRGGSTRDARFVLAYVDWRLAFVPEAPRETPRASLLEEAESLLQTITEEHRADAEALALLGSIYGTQIADGGNVMRLGPRATRAIEEAGRLAPHNPRVALLRGLHFLFTPQVFGGGLERAETELRRAEQLFESERNQPWPNWGRVDALAWLGQVLTKRKDLEGARAAYARGLAIEPNHMWIRSLAAALGSK